MRESGGTFFFHRNGVYFSLFADGQSFSATKDNFVCRLDFNICMHYLANSAWHGSCYYDVEYHRNHCLHQGA